MKISTGPARRAGYMKSYEAGARRWLGVIARDLDRPALEKMHPSFLADVALLAYAGHESSHLNNIIGSLNYQENHEAVGPENDDPCWAVAKDHSLDHDAFDEYPDTAVKITATDDRIRMYTSYTAGYLKARTDCRTELAALTAMYFAGMDPAEFASTVLYCGNDLIRHFGYGEKDDLDYLSEIGAADGNIADLGMGTHSIIYQNFRVMPGRFMLVDNNPFTAVFNRTYISLCGRESSFYVVEADVTKNSVASGITQGSIRHAGSNSLTHHIYNDRGAEGLEGFANFLWFILPRSGTFRIIDHGEKAPFADVLERKLRAAGFLLDINDTGAISRFWSTNPKAPFIIDGIKS